MLTKLFLEDGIVDVEPLISAFETALADSVIVYDKNRHMLVIQSEDDIKEKMSKMDIKKTDIIGYEVER